jgi:hypothetical protein
MFLATAGSQLLLGCAGQPAAGVPAPMQHKWLSLSRDGGRSWRQLTSPPTFAGYMTDVSLAPGGPLAESGSDADPRFSWDGGRSWHTSPGLRAAYDASAGTGLAVTMVTHAFGFALDGYLYYPRIFLTRDSGHAWSAETVR